MDRRLKHLLVRYPALGRMGRKIKYRFGSRQRSVFEGDLSFQDADCVSMKLDQLKKIPVVGIVKDHDPLPYYTKYERFCRNNRIPFRFVDIHSSRWQEEAAFCDCLVWRPLECPWDLEEFREKLSILKDVLHQPTLPAFEDALMYGSKSAQYERIRDKGYPLLKTFITHDYSEACDWIRSASYPFVHKSFPSSSSQGVVAVRSKRKAQSLVQKAFGPGLKTCWPGRRQKNILFFQEYLPHMGFDLRVTVIDENHIFGYYRKAPKGDFRASGLSPTIKKSLPRGPIETALALKKELKSVILSVDFLQSAENKKFYITEFSPLIKVITCEQLHVNGRPGCYIFDKNTGRLSFRPGRFWLQELALREFLLRNFGKESR